MSETKTDRFDVMFRGLVVFLFLTFVFIIEFNPFGSAQFLIWQMRPPYHWVQTHNNIDEEHLVDKNGSTCATIYDFEGQWKYYGYGFSGGSTSKDYVVHKSEANCP